MPEASTHERLQGLQVFPGDVHRRTFSVRARGAVNDLADDYK